MSTLVIHTKSLSRCVQCDMTVRAAEAEGVQYELAPGIDTPERADELAVFKEQFNLAAAPIVEALDSEGRVLERWAGFVPDKIKEYAS